MNLQHQDIEDYKPAMGNRLRSYRLRANLTQEKMAELLDISIKHYSEVERGLKGLSVENLIKLSNLLDVSLDYLLKGESENKTFPPILIEMYETCPGEKKTHLLALAREIMKLSQNPPT